MKIRPILAALVLTGLFAGHVQAAEPAGEPKVASVLSAMGSTSTVTAINHKTREVTLKGADGVEQTLVAGEEVRNLPQVKVGDIVQFTYAERLAVKLYPVKSSAVGSTERTEVSRSELGQMPYANIKNITTLTGKVAALDKAKRTVTLAGEEGELTLQVEKGQDLSQLSVGQMIKAEYVENLILSVERPKN